MSHWPLIVALLVGWFVGTVTVVAIVFRRLRQSAELERVLQLVRVIVRERSIPIDVEIDQELEIPLNGSYTIPSNLQFAVHMDEPIEIEAKVPVRANIPLDAVVESSVFKIGVLKVPIQGDVPVNVDIPVQTQARIRSEALHVRLSEELKLDLPKLTVPLKARLRVNIPLRLPETNEPASSEEPAVDPASAT